MKIKAEDTTLRRYRTALPFCRPVRSFNPSTHPFGKQKIEFEGDPDVALISADDFVEIEFVTCH